MPVSNNSRYARVPVIEAADTNGKVRPTIGIRPGTSVLPAIYAHRVIAAESLESLAWRHYRNSSYWWRIADANGLKFPLDWTPGELLGLPAVSDVGRIERRRSF
jgi:hypothetical protein